MAEELHVLFGSGQVGQPLARILLARGKRVRIVKRSTGGLPEGVELVRGDATDLNFCVDASRAARQENPRQRLTDLPAAEQYVQLFRHHSPRKRHRTSAVTGLEA